MYPTTGLCINKDEYDSLQQKIEQTHLHNAWFTFENIRLSFESFATWLHYDTLIQWSSPYSFAEKPKKVGLIMAGNIPMVGFHDFLCTILSGHHAVCKLSSDDTFLWKTILTTFDSVEPRLKAHYTILEGKLGEIDAILATGSDNSSRYFDSYFGKYPHIFRKNRTSVAVLDGSETQEDLYALGSDIFNYFGLGCRNVSHLLVPNNYNWDDFFQAILPYQHVIHHHKYANNYDYNKAVSLLNNEKLLENGFLLLKESELLHSPLAMLHYTYYENESNCMYFIEQNHEKIQAIVGKNHTLFGQSQHPSINDYADNVNTMEFLTHLD